MARMKRRWCFDAGALRRSALPAAVALTLAGQVTDGLASGAGRAQRPGTVANGASTLRACSIDAWVVERDPAGLNVRAGAHHDAPILGTLPAYVPDGERRGFGIPVRITAARNGWFRIAGAHDDPARSGKPPRSTYPGEGWVAANMVRFKLQSGRAHTAPLPSSRVLLDIGSDDVTELGEITRVRDCVGDWVQVDLRLNARRDPKTDALLSLPAERQMVVERAWLRGVCANQETTCDRRPP